MSTRQGEKKTVLIVDDMENWRNLLTNLLKNKFDVFACSSYKEAKDSVIKRDPPFHVAILDIRLVDEDSKNQEGLELANFLNNMGEYTKSIILTGYPTIENIKKSFKDLGVFEYMEKKPESEKPESENDDEFDYDLFLRKVSEAANQAENQRSRKFLIRGTNVLLVAKDESIQKQIEEILRMDNYNIESVKELKETSEKINSHSFDLFIICEDILSTNPDITKLIRQNNPDAKTIAIKKGETDYLVEALKSRKLQDIINIKEQSIAWQEFRGRIRRLFAYQFTKYIDVNFNEEKFTVGHANRLILTIGNHPNERTRSTSIWLSPSEVKEEYTLLELSIYAPDIKIPNGEDIYWEIQSSRDSSEIEFEIIPKTSGHKRVIIDIDYNQTWLGRIEKDFFVSSTSDQK